MWIRTSDKKRVIFCGTVGKLEVNEFKDKTEELIFEPDGKGYVLLNGECLGEYATEQRAIQVLDWICNAYSESCYCDLKYDSSANNERPFLNMKNIVFEMPEE